MAIRSECFARRGLQADQARGKARAPSQIAAGVLDIAQKVIDVVHASHIAAFLLALLQAIHHAKRDETGFCRRETSSEFQLRALFNVKLELLFELAFDTIPLE